MMFVSVIVVAAGRSERMGGDVPKPLLKIGGRSMLRRSIETFDAHPAVAELVVVLPAACVADGPALAGATRRPCAFVAGGERRQDSVRAGVEQLAPEADLILIHDAARPFANRALIDRVIAAAVEA